jgi:hypothetical protein
VSKQMAYYTLLTEYRTEGTAFVLFKNVTVFFNAIDHITGTMLIIWPNSGP